MAKLQLDDLATTGSVVGRLSAWATAGGLAGTFATGFVIVPLLATDVALFALGGALLVLALLLGRGAAPWSGSVLGLVAVAVVLGAAAVAVGVPCDAETRYHCARVDRDPQRASGRVLVLENLRHSYVDLDDPRRLEFDYIRWMGDAIDGAAPRGEPLAGVFLGGAGFTLPRYLLATRPGSARAGARGRPRARRRRPRAARAAHRPRPARRARRRAGDARGRAHGVGRRARRRRVQRPLRAVAARDGRVRARDPAGAAARRRLRAQRHRPAAAEAGAAPRSRRCARCSATSRWWRRAAAAATTSCWRPRGGCRRSPRPRDGRRLDAARFAGDADVLRDMDAPADQLLSRR